MKRTCKLALQVAAPLALAACGQPEPVKILPPATLATCADQPVTPSLPGKDQQAERDRQTLEYLLALRAAYGDCRARVDGLAQWMKG